VLTKKEIIIVLIALFLAGGAYLTAAQVRNFSFVPPQRVVYWTPPHQFGKVASGWEPPAGYEKTAHAWAPPEGFSAPPDTWQAPEGWGTPPVWQPLEQFKGKIIREEER
jgi:hypothetical protein